LNVLWGWISGFLSALFVFYISYWHQQHVKLRELYENDISAIKHALYILYLFIENSTDLTETLNEETKRVLIRDLHINPDKIVDELIRITTDVQNLMQKYAVVSDSIYKSWPRYFEEIVNSFEKVSYSGWAVFEHDKKGVLSKTFMLFKTLSDDDPWTKLSIELALMSNDEKLHIQIIKYVMIKMNLLTLNLVDTGLLEALIDQVNSMSFRKYKKIYSKVFGYKLYPFF